MAASLLLYLTWSFPSGDEFAKFIPTASTFRHFGQLLTDASGHVRDEAVPVSDFDGLLLLTIAGGSDLGLHEVNEAAEIIADAADTDANIIFGTVIDDALGDEVKVTVIAAGFAGEHKERSNPLRAVTASRQRQPAREPQAPAPSTPSTPDPAHAERSAEVTRIDVTDDPPRQQPRAARPPVAHQAPAAPPPASAFHFPMRALRRNHRRLRRFASSK